MSYSVLSNLISLVISTIVILVIPKLIGVEEYGYWQLFVFYSSYVGFLHFGWNDGIYLRYGGEEYESLDKKLFFSQFIQLVIVQACIGGLIFLFSVFFVDDLNRSFIWKMVAVTLVVLNVRFMFFFILQATNRIKEYARLTILDRFVYIGLIILFLVFGVRNYQLMILADVIGKLISLIFAFILCKDIVFNRLSHFYFSITETIANIRVGISLMFANIASTLIIGTVKFGIERNWNVATFGKVSLTLSISNMMMIFINAVGVIIFPVLRRTKREKLAVIYIIMRDLLMALLLGVLVFYYPLKTMMSAWLPQYADSLLYMALAFPMFTYEGKMSLLINTYLKTLRKEKLILRVNVMSMVLSFILTVTVVKIFNNLELTVLNIVILLAFRSALAEYFLARELKIQIRKDLILETMMTIIFISSGWYINSWFMIVVYGFAYIIYLIIKKNNIKESIVGIKVLLKE
ncbi:MATE family efflux transporter [Jeotgalibaca ciconiae]|uniref:Flippase n=1 Tax=Jeotgalibaca ciconiae TaxID=2496265 RepID=A0A3Q9BMN4_9LACT|nr:hypothetical protein [Jeotgalibaca ciconiae]AZP05754.1 hypothetical protein EJN90_09870 [Jeotgalibaca ciconiae]